MINPAKWLTLSRETRLKIAEILNIPRTANVEVSNNRVVCDGHSAQDLLGITVEKLQAALNSEETDVYKLFEQMVSELESEPVTPKIIEEKPVEQPVVTQPEVAGPYVDKTVKPVEPKKVKAKK